MGLLSAGDWAQMAADLAEVRGDNEVSVVLRRGSTTVTAQNVRVARTGGGSRVEGTSNRSQESRGRAVVLGGTTQDIQPGDRFTDENGVVYRVVTARPNRRAGVMAECEVVE